MIVAELAPTSLERQLRQDGLCVRIGPLVVKMHSAMRAVRHGIAMQYAGHPVEPGEAFADFHVSVDQTRAVCRWWNPQVVFRFDGTEPMAPMPGNQGFAMLERGLGWCVSSHCHQYLILRAAVLERCGRALILPAPSGSGKSTLCAGLAFGGGWRLLSDELALIDPATSRVVPLPRPVSLKNDSIDVIGRFAPNTQFGEVVHETIKGRVAHARPPQDAVLLADQKPLPAWVVLPRYEAGAAAQLTPLSRARAFMALVDNAFNYNVHGRAGFEAFADLIDRCDCHEFTYSSLPEAVAVFDQLAHADR